ncbi:MAG: hypothetical protein IPO26_15885 [Saprospiraceae bacterium]|nr:hypothetical protein [Saprospiraceae bacterium]
MKRQGKLGASNNDKKFLIDVYTDWCGWCKVMDKRLLQILGSSSI